MADIDVTKAGPKGLFKPGDWACLSYVPPATVSAFFTHCLTAAVAWGCTRCHTPLTAAGVVFAFVRAVRAFTRLERMGDCVRSPCCAHSYLHRCGNINWERRDTCNVCNTLKPTLQEQRTGRGGGYNERQEMCVPQ